MRLELDALGSSSGFNIDWLQVLCQCALPFQALRFTHLTWERQLPIKIRQNQKNLLNLIFFFLFQQHIHILLHQFIFFYFHVNILLAFLFNCLFFIHVLQDASLTTITLTSRRTWKMTSESIPPTQITLQSFRLIDLTSGHFPPEFSIQYVQNQKYYLIS